MLSVHTSQIFLITNLQSIVRFFNAHQPLYKTRRLNALNEHRFSATNYKVPTIPPNERNIKRKKIASISENKKINLREKTLILYPLGLTDLLSPLALYRERQKRPSLLVR